MHETADGEFANLSQYTANIFGQFFKFYYFFVLKNVRCALNAYTTQHALQTKGVGR